MPNENGRTHEPSLREVTAELDGVRELFFAKLDALKELVNERHSRYEERFKAQETSVATALAAAEKQTAASFMSSEKAVTKAEDAQRDYNQRSNEFRGQLDDQAKTLMPRSEVNAIFTAQNEKIDELKTSVADLRQSRSESIGRDKMSHVDRQQTHWSIGLVISTGVGLAAILVSLIALFR